jgi:hypothetical protein
VSDLREWAGLYQTPLWLTAAFIALLTLFALTPDPSRTAADVGSNPTSEPTPGPHECIVCPIDQTCDAESGRCVFIDATPLPCVEGAKFDEKAGFCLPTGEPTIPPELLATPEASEERLETSEPASDSGPAFETERPVDTPEPVETERP